jgi:hypothetical protein
MIIILSIIITSTLVFLFVWIQQRRESNQGPPLPEQPEFVVEMDDEWIRNHRPAGKIEQVRWSDLQAVILETTDEGPGVCDVFWILVGKGSGCVIPQDAGNGKELLQRLQELPDFDNRKVIEAMGSSENAKFLCWERKDKD